MFGRSRTVKTYKIDSRRSEIEAQRHLISSDARRCDGQEQLPILDGQPRDAELGVPDHVSAT
jgi:hypothetical protein